MSEEDVNFYEPTDKYGQFSNVYVSPFQVDSVVYRTNEHYFQSHKHTNPAHIAKIVQAESPYDAFDLGNSRQFPIREDWAQAKQQVMYDGLKLKFTQNLHCKEVLLATGNKNIVEHTVNDSYWGDGGDGSGKNRLGILLMKLRDQLK